MNDINPITLEVVRNSIYSVAEEMRGIVMRSARSPLLREAGDLSCALTDGRGRLIAQGIDIPLHLGVMAYTVKEFLKHVDAARLRPGDMYITNAPAVGGNHLPDVKLFKPVFHGDEIVAFAINLAHWPDIGGTVPGSYYTRATEIYQEGLQIPPVRLFHDGGPDEALMEFILSNVRRREDREGDIYAQRAANEVAGRRLAELFERYGTETVQACFERFHDESDALMRAEIAKLPDGDYYGEDFMDDDGITDRAVKIAVTVRIRGDRASFDFTGTDPQVAGPVNITRYVVCSAVYYSCKALLAPDIPTNDGCYRGIEVIVPPGCLLNPGPTAPIVAGNHETSRRICDAIFKALAPIVPDQVTAGNNGSSNIFILSGHRGDGSGRYILYETMGGGEGAGETWDGDNGIHVTMGNTMSTPTEVFEADYPILVEEHSLITGSGGAGRTRGGMGIRRSFRLLGEEAQAVTVVERAAIAPWGLFGGEPGRPAAVVINPGLESEQKVRGKSINALKRGDVITIDSAGGGGYGNPGTPVPST